MPKQKQANRILVALLIVLGLFISGVSGAILSRSIGADRDLRPFWEAWKLVEQSYSGNLPDPQHRAWAAISGALGEVDSCAALAEPASSEVAEGNLSGRFGGVGASWIRGEDGRPIFEPMADGPAARAGVQQGDTLLAVDDTEITSEMTDDEILGLIRGDVGTAVRLTLLHPGESEPYTVDITREEISSASVNWRMLDQAQGIGYIGFWIFTQESPGELDKALDELQAQGMKRLVLDLRGNSGGDVQGSFTVAAGFLPEGIIGYQLGKDGTETTWNVDDAGPYSSGPLAILIDGYTSSGAELVAATLRERGRAVLVGEKTRGCASVFSVYTLSDGSSLYLRSADLLTANHKPIPAAGLSPDILVSITEQDRSQGRDPQLDRAIEHLTTGE